MVEEKIKYQSKEGFEEVPIIRGTSDVAPLWKMFENKGIYICGGYVRWMCSPRPTPELPSDVDIYCHDEDAFEYAMNKIEKEMKLEVKWENDMSKGYKKPEKISNPLFCLPTINLIKPMEEGRIVAMGDVKTILENFDFTVVRCAIISIEPEPKAMVDADFYHDEEKKILRLKNIHCPVSSTMRCMKYSRKGYFLPPFQALGLFLDWEQRADSYREKLVEFLDKSTEGDGLSKEEVEEMEAMMRID